MATLIYTIFTIAHILLLIWGLRLWRQSGSIRLFLVLLPIIGLVYDNAVIALGSLPGPGELLQSLNVGRFLLHAIITPMLIMAALDMARRAGVGWASNQIVFALFGVFTVILILFGLSEMPRITSLLATEAHIQKTVKNVQDTNSSFTIHNSYWTLAFLF